MHFQKCFSVFHNYKDDSVKKVKTCGSLDRLWSSGSVSLSLMGVEFLHRNEKRIFFKILNQNVLGYTR